MSSLSGYVNYIEYQYASNKGQTKIGDKISSPFGFGDVDVEFTGEKVTETADASGTTTLAWTPIVKGFFDDNGTPKDVKIIATDGTVTYADVNAQNQVTAAVGTKIAYVYDNVVIPQNDLPQIKAEMKSIALVAKARRIAIYYSQIAAYQA